MAGNDSNTKLLLHLDGNATDDSIGGSHSPSASNVNYTSTGVKAGFGQFGQWNGSTSQITVADSADWDFGTGDFTVDFQIKTSATGVSDVIIHHLQASGQGTGWFVNVNTSNHVFFECSGGGSRAYVEGSTNVADGSWHHVACVRDTVTNGLMIFVDGTEETYTTTNNRTGNYNGDNAETLGIGDDLGKSAYVGGDYTGDLDEIRISDTARWTSNFTAPTAPYSIDIFETNDIKFRPFSAALFTSDDIKFRPFSVSSFTSGDIKFRPLSAALFTSADIKFRPFSVASFTSADIKFRPQGYGPQRYNLYIYNLDTGSLVDSTTVNDPTVTASFTTPADGNYILYVYPESMYEGRYPSSSIKFTITGGLLQVLLPNAPYNLTAEVIADGKIKLTWLYNSTNQAVAPAAFYVYKGTTGSPLAVDYGTVIGTESYTNDGEYTFTTTTLSEVPTVFAVRAATSGSPANVEQNTTTVTATPDNTNPTGIPFTFDWS